MDKHSQDSATNIHFLSQLERRRRELWLYIAVSIVAIELLIAVAFLFYGFIKGSVSEAPTRLMIPWLSWLVSAVTIPCIMLLCLHLAIGLFNPSLNSNDEEWQQHLPKKLQRAYLILSRAPAVVLLMGIIFLCGALLTIDGAFHLINNLFLSFKPYFLHIAIGVGVLIAIIVISTAWLTYRTRKLMAEYAYRREVLEKTGYVIIDSKTHMLLPGEDINIKNIYLENTPTPVALPESRSENEIIDIETKKQ